MSELLKSIHGKLTKQLERTGRVILDARLFGAPQPLLEDLFERYFHGTNRQLRIGKVEGYQYDEVEGAIVFKGTGQGEAFDGMTIEQVLITVTRLGPVSPCPRSRLTRRRRPAGACRT